MEQRTSLTLLGEGDVKVGEGGTVARNSRQALTYDDLVEKIFSSEHIVVL
jgi:hypothetical protein